MSRATICCARGYPLPIRVGVAQDLAVKADPLGEGEDMGYLPQFENDFFISYRHAANDTHDRWVDAFEKALKENLGGLVGDIKIWRDTERLRTGETWRPDIAKALDSAAIFIAIISRTYFDSDECRKELDQFLGWLKDPGSGAQRKIVPIFKQPPRPDQELPHELAEVQDHKFFDWNPRGSHRFREFSPAGDAADARDFWETLSRLAQDLMVTLEELQGSARTRALGRVFLARVGPELQLERERLRADFQQRGYLVVPEREYLWNADDHRERIARDLESACLCVHLVSPSASIEPATSVRAQVQLQLAHDAMKARSGPAPMVWIQPAAEVDASASDLLDFIRNDLANEGVEYWQGGLEDFKTEIYDKLPKAPAPKAPAPVRRLALIVEESDVGALGPLKSVLVDGLGIEPQSIKFVGSVPKDATRLARALNECDKCLVFWGSQSEEWLQDLLADPALAPCLGRDRLAVYIASPASEEKRVFRSTKACAIPALDGSAGDPLSVFVNSTSAVTR